MQQRKTDFWVGMFVLLGVFALVALTLTVGAKGWRAQKETYAVSANFAGVGTLKIDAPVKLAGVEIGRVRGIDLINDNGVYKGKVDMVIEQQVKLPADSHAMIYTTGLLGAQFVNIEQGVDTVNYLGNGGVITDTEQAMQLEEALKNFGVKQIESDAQDDGKAKK